MSAIPTVSGRRPDVTAPKVLLSFIGVVLLLAFGASFAVTAASDIAPVHAALILGLRCRTRSVDWSLGGADRRTDSVR